MKQRLLRKVFTSFLLLFTVLSLFTPTKVHAIETGDEPTEFEYTDGYFFGRLYFYNAGGQLAYCVEPHVVFESGHKSSITLDAYNKLSDSIKNRVQLIDYYAKTLGAETNSTIRATAQFMIWEAVHERFKVANMNFTNYSHETYNQIAGQINEMIDNHYLVPSFNQSSHQLKVGQSITLSDTNQVLDKYQLVSTDPSVVSVAQNQNSITLTAHKSGSAVIKGKKVAPKYIGTSLVFLGGSSQDIGVFYLTDAINTSLNVNVKALSQLKIVKTDTENQRVSGIKFSLSKNENMSEPIGTYTTNKQGEIMVSNLDEGTYYVQEVSVKAPYLLDKTIHKVVLKAGETTTFNQINEVVKGKISIVKHDDSKPLAKAVFEVKNEAGELITTLETNERGQAESNLLNLGTYYVQEVKAPEGYQLDNQIHQVVLDYLDDKTPIIETRLNLTNKLIKGRVRIVKTDSNNHEIPLENVKFNLLSLPDRRVVEELITDENGVAESQELTYGDYLIVETEAPNTYYLNPKEYPVSITQQGQVVVESITNERIALAIKLNKVDQETQEPLANAVFQVQDDSGKIVIDELITDKNGQAISEVKLTTGDYTLIEVKAPSGYLLNSPIHFTINRDTEFVELDVVGKTKELDITNVKTTIEIHKVDIHGNFLEGARLVLMDEDREVVSFISNHQPFELRGLEVNKTYTLIETQAPEGYLISDPVEITIGETQDTQIFTMINEYEPKLKTVAFFEHDKKETNPVSDLKVFDRVSVENLWPNKAYVLKGQVIDVLSQEVLSTATKEFTASDDAMILTMEFNLDAKDYVGRTLVISQELFKDEKLLASHTDLNDKDQQIMILNPQIKTEASTLKRNPEKPQFITIVDTVSYQDLVINDVYTVMGTLMDKDTNQPFLIDGEPVQSKAEFEALTNDGKVTLSFSFDQKYLKEGSLVIFEELFFNDELIAEHKDINDKKQTVRILEIDITKVDALNHQKVLPGAEFTLYQGDLEVGHEITDDNGKLRFYVEAGSWSLVETKAPVGYRLNSNKIELEDMATSVKLEIDNTKIQPLPKTGTEVAPIWYLILSISLITIGVKMMRKKKKREE